MAGQGLGSEDFRRRASIPTLSRSPNGHSNPDPIAEARSIRRELIADKIIDQATSETDADAMEAKNRALKAEIEFEQLKEARHGGGASDKYLELMMAQMADVQHALADTQRQLSEQQLSALQERINIITAELQRVSESKPEVVNPYKAAAETIEQATHLFEMIHPKVDAPVATPKGVDSTVVAWETAKRYEHDRWLAERADRHEENLMKIKGELDIAREKLALERQSAQTKDRFFETYGPKAMEYLGPMLEKVLGAVQGGAGAGAGMASNAMAQAQLPEGVEVQPCSQCGQPIFFRPEFGGVICSRCGAQYDFSQPPPQEASQPNSQYDGTPMGEQSSSPDNWQQGTENVLRNIA